MTATVGSNEPDALREILECETIAVVGCSRTPGKAAHDVPAYMLEQGYDVVPVNPFADEIFGREAFDSLADVDEQSDDDIDIDIVCVFRPSDEVAGVVESVLESAVGDVIWLQQGIRDDQAAERAVDAGYRVVQDRCLKVDHRRLVV
ncbi:CoA-binding protein [Natrialba chahannaoensis JCM 10990]|uniref:CoA-binding protein n=1 Tax=Natrialba chahannaoensis JCM 10990 TaxID=1227492 RepID=M0AR92_9EURY|nr:CoA-binding protein [Natrialba chahannaoensis]ELY99903.1 CoA-binding protein [Natrialba chahannaoensis JCM 10990]